jgi:type II secretory pathway pseudopilin PulG
MKTPTKPPSRGLLPSILRPARFPHPSSLIPHPFSAAAFTLIELLAVMLIAVLLISLGYAGYNEMRKTTGVGTAARNVADALNLARQSAVAAGHRARFLFRVGGSYGDTHYQYAVVREVPGLRINGQRYWEYVSEWQGLPMGVVFAGSFPPPTNSITGLVNYDNTQIYTNATTWYTNRFYRADPPPSTRYYTIEFSREGRPSQTWTVTVARGYYSGSGSSFVTSGVDYASVILDSQTGKSRVVRK